MGYCYNTKQQKLFVLKINFLLSYIYLQLKVKSHMSQGGPHGQSLTRFCGMKPLKVLLLPPEWDASPSQGYPQQYVAGNHFIHLGGERSCGVKFLV